MYMMSIFFNIVCAALFYVWLLYACLIGGLGQCAASGAPRQQLVDAQLQLRRLLDVEETAEASEIKAAYRKRALKLHPDVNQAADATQRFAELSHAYGMVVPCTACSLLRAPLAV